MDASLGFPVGAAVPARPTLHGLVHEVAGPLAIVSLAAAAFLSRRVLLERAGSARGAVVAGVAVLLFFATCSVLVSLDYSGAWTAAPSGLFERLALYTGMAWVAHVQVARVRAGE